MSRSHVSKWLLAGLMSIATASGAVGAPGQVKIESMTEPVKTITTSGAHRVIVYDANSLHLNATAAYLIDGDTGKIEGMIGTGEQSNLGFAPGGGRIYVADTYWSRLDRGTRTDVVTTYDTATLKPVHEVKIPPKRFIITSTKADAAATPDGRYMLVFNETPATSVTVVDVKRQKYVGGIDTSGCWGVFPSADDRFEMLCGNGSLLTVSFSVNGSGRLESKAHEGKPFFDVVHDPVFAAPGIDPRHGRIFFLTFHGIVHPVDVSGATPGYEPTWSILTQADKSEHWLPGGWLPEACNSRTGRLYVLMHKGGKWTHKMPGEEVWVFDTRTHKRIRRIHLREKATSVAISADGSQLYALSEAKATLDIYDTHAHKLLHTVDQLGSSPAVLYTSNDW